MAPRSRRFAISSFANPNPAAAGRNSSATWRGFASDVENPTSSSDPSSFLHVFTYFFFKVDEWFTTTTIALYKTSMTSLTTTSQYDNSSPIPTNYAIDIGHGTNDIQPVDEQHPREPVSMKSWSVILFLMAIGFLLLALCFYRIYYGFKSSATASRQVNNNTTGAASSQSSALSSTGKHSPRNRKRLVMEYLRDHSDNEMVGHYDFSGR